MTTVFVLVGQTDYAGDTILGVYASVEEAYAQYITEHSAYDDYDTQKIEIGAAAEFRW